MSERERWVLFSALKDADVDENKTWYITCRDLFSRRLSLVRSLRRRGLERSYGGDEFDER